MAIQARHFRQWFAFLLLLALGGTAAWFLMPREWSQMQWEIPGTPSEYPLAQLLRPWLILLGCFLPALGMLLYNRSGILDRYVARTWFTAFIMCTAILTLIYIIGDFADNVGDLMNLDSPLAGTFRFYLSQLPMILNLILPYTLLLGTLWALTKLSSSSEITGMLQSGRSLLRINAPVIIGAVFAAIYFGIFGFHWAPNSTLYRKLMFSSLSQNKNDDASRSTIYKNDAESRIWYLGDPPGIDSPGEPFRQVRVEQFSAPGKMEYELFADEAMWDPASRTWTFRQAIKRNYSQEEPRQLNDVPVFAGQEYQTLKEHYPETPWQLISPNVRVDTQGTPALQEIIRSGTTNAKYLRSLQTEWHVRIARMFSCIILTFIAIPSAITFQRRSAMSGIGIALFLAAAMLFLYEFFPTLASAGYLPTWLGAWMPNIIYTIIAIRLFQTKLAHRSFMEMLGGLKKTPVHDQP